MKSNYGGAMIGVGPIAVLHTAPGVCCVNYMTGRIKFLEPHHPGSSLRGRRPCR